MLNRAGYLALLHFQVRFYDFSATQGKIQG